MYLKKPPGILRKRIYSHDYRAVNGTFVGGRRCLDWKRHNPPRCYEELLLPAIQIFIRVVDEITPAFKRLGEQLKAFSDMSK